MAAKTSNSVGKKVPMAGAKKAGKGARKSATAGAKAVANRRPKQVPKSGSAKAAPNAASTKGKGSVKKTVKEAVKKSVEKPAKKASTEPSNVATTQASQVNASQAVSAGATGLNVGDMVPVFDALDQTGQTVSNRDWAGAPYVLYFYPKDDTPGCTTEACGFRDELSSFGELGVKVVGCSPDSPNAHTRFATKYGLQFTLLADIEKDLAQLFGVWKLKQNYGREYMGVERSTFLIDKSGKLARQWRGVRVAGHVSEVLSAVRDLT